MSVACACGEEGEFRLLKKGPFTCESPRFCRTCVHPGLGDAVLCNGEGVSFKEPNNAIPRGTQYTLRYSVQQRSNQSFCVKITIGSTELSMKQPVPSNVNEGVCPVFVQGEMVENGGYFPFHVFKDTQIFIELFSAKFLKHNGRIVRVFIDPEAPCISRKVLSIKCK